MAAERFVLRPKPPIRALGLSAAIVLIAAVVFVLGVDQGSTPAAAVGVVLAIGALVLLGLALLGRLRQTTTVVVDTDGLSIRSAGRRAGARWSEINQVRAEQHHLYLWTDRDDGETLQIVCPRGGTDPQVQALSELLARRLDADRGYQTL